MKLLRNFVVLKIRAGLILTEALTAIASLTLGVIVLSTIITNAVSTTKVSRDYLLAKTLITEAIETVKNIRDTNWLTQPTNKNCWLVLNPASGSGCGPQANVGSNYLAIFDRNSGKWFLQSGPSDELDLATYSGSDSQESYRLFVDRIGEDGDIDFYANSPEGTSIASNFYRNIKFTEIDAGNDFARLKITVEWLDGAKVRNITRELTLYNYLE